MAIKRISIYHNLESYIDIDENEIPTDLDTNDGIDKFFAEHLGMFIKVKDSKMVYVDHTHTSHMQADVYE